MAGLIRSTIEARFGDRFSLGCLSSFKVVAMAPQWEWPITTTKRVPNSVAANSILPIWEGPTILPATRITKRLPNPWSKMISKGTRASEHPSKMAKGSCSDTFGLRSPGFCFERVSPNQADRLLALSAFDVDCSFHLEKIKSTFKLLDNGLLELDESYYKGAILDQPNLYTEKLVKLLGGRVGIKGAEPDDWHYSIAKAMQIVFEEIVIHMLSNLYERTKLKNVVLGGGSFMNSVFNGKVIENTPFENVYISHSPSDVGNSIGAALYVAHNLKNEDRNSTFNSSYLGPSFSDEEIQKTLERRKIVYEKIEDIPKTVSNILSRGEIIARFNGRMEFGERALGNRSILADPRAENIKDKINSIIKYREGYRPFAPVIIQEKVCNYFDVSETFTCHYMEKVVQIKKEFHKELPAVTHVDGSGRVQTVSEKHNLSFYQIIKEFELLTGLPIVLNTSFNIAGEPVVLSPDDALTTFYNSGLEYLIIGSFLVKK